MIKYVYAQAGLAEDRRAPLQRRAAVLRNTFIGGLHEVETSREEIESRCKRAAGNENVRVT